MISLVSFVFVIFVIVLVHEFGHFIVAKKFGIKVTEFSIGFGPKLLSKKYGETEYVLRPIPIGGFVDLYGMEEESVDDADFNRSFISKKPYKRFLTLFAGSFMNYVLAFVVMFGVLFFAGALEPVYSELPVVGFVAEDSFMDKAGLKTGDEIKMINNEEIKSWAQFRKVFLEVEREINLTVMRNQNIVELSLPTSEFNSLQEAGVFQGKEPVIGEVTPGQEADRAGIMKGDRIISVNNNPVLIWEEVVSIIHNSIDQQLLVEVKRLGETEEFEVTPHDVLNEGYGIIGIAPEVSIGSNLSFIESLKGASRTVISLNATMIDMLKKLLTLQVSVKNLSGPVGIASVVGEKANEGFALLFYMLAFISINIGFLNLMPFPALDGGRLLFIVIEGIGSVILKRKFKVSTKVEESIHYIGLVFLIFLILIVTYRDILRLFGLGD
ncbi:MAG: RIP metalloprotease RseP [Candidatus Muiribacteriota bacterium]